MPGPEVEAFEAAFAAYCGATRCVGVEWRRTRCPTLAKC
jgi:dTDP-4-amino-4,6-dideoxygalactose transaminase